MRQSFHYCSKFQPWQVPVKTPCRSIFDQSIQDFEVIFLDDASTDNSSGGL